MIGGRGTAEATEVGDRVGSLALAVGTAALLATPSGLAAQQAGGPGSEVRIGGLLRTGLRVGPSDLGRTDGFSVFDARARTSGRVGIVFDHLLQVEWDPRREELRLLDAKLTLPVAAPFRLELGQFKAPFGKEASKEKREIVYVERSQASQLVAPARQVGVQGTGEALEGRLRYAAGVFNGNGRTFANDDDGFLFAGRAEFNNVGAAEFYDELVVELGASLAFSEDSAVDLSRELARPVAVTGLDFASFRGERVLWGGDLRVGYRGFFLRGEYLRAELEPAGSGTLGAAVLPATPGGDVTLSGGYLEGGYDLWGAIQAVVRWDALQGPVESVDGHPVNSGPDGGSDFVVFGLQLFPGYATKVGFQYALGLDGTRVGPGLADGEFQMMVQVEY